MRLSFVILTPACVLVGLGTAVWSTGEVNYIYFTLALIGAIAAHISVNAFNEYFDFKSGLDHRTHRTPFSGGSGTFPDVQQYDLATHLLLGNGMGCRLAYTPGADDADLVHYLSLKGLLLLIIP